MKFRSSIPMLLGSTLLLLTVGTALAEKQPNQQPAYQPGEPGHARSVVLDIMLHDKKDIFNMLKRAEELTLSPNPANRPQKVTLVLHGPEIELFRISRYTKNRSIVNLAAKLDAFNVVDVKMCNTRMSMMGIEKTDIPAFVEIVPYGPAEVDRLQSRGFLKL